jgi:hypothetical protein
MFFISNIGLVLNVVFFLLGDSLTSEFNGLTFRNTVCPIFIGGVSGKNNWDEIARILVKVGPRIALPIGRRGEWGGGMSE